MSLREQGPAPNHSRSLPAMLVCLLAALGAGCSTTTHRLVEDPAVNDLASDSLRKFRNMAEFDEYRDHVREVGKRRNVYWSQVLPHRNERVLLAQTEETCDPSIENCGEGEGGDTLQEAVVTGSRVARPASITNNQEADVDEGDIVKQYGRFLIVLQDGRLFSIDVGSSTGGMRLVDRLNVYSSPKTGTWYDELLIHDNSLIVTGYNYAENASEINVISINDAGELDFQARYFLESEDYYSFRNYASRLVRGQFVVYTPVDISAREALKIPRIRSWTAAAGFSEWTPLFDITDVYRPVQETLTPMLHVVSVCSLSPRDGFRCNSRGVVGPTYREVYVSSTSVYLWLTSDYLDWGFESGPNDCPQAAIESSTYVPLPATVFRMPIEGQTVRAVHTIGAPYDQFAFDERNNRLLALLMRLPAGCSLNDTTPMMFTSIPLSSFDAAPDTTSEDDYVSIPSSTGWALQNRYATDYLVYGNPQGYWYWKDDAPERDDLIVVPIARPAQFSVLHPGHTIERVELIGDNAVAFGRAGESDLGVSTIDLGGTPHVADSRALADLRESEGRSHAFNSLIDTDGSGVFGLPTVYQSNSRDASDVQFFETNRQLTLTPVGELSGQDDEDGTYKCEVSCVDWYGNARPIFTEGRVFALTGSELVEGQIGSGSIIEIGRLRITGTPQRQR